MKMHRIMSLPFQPPFRLIVITATSLLLAATLSSGSGYAAPGGELDASFGANGRLLMFGDARAMLQQPDDGKLLIGGSLPGAVDGSDFAVLRLNLDGSLDDGFGTNGIVTIDFDGAADIATELALQPDGKIIAAGTANVGEVGSGFAIARLDPNGALDTTFDGDGRVSLGLNGAYDQLSGMVLAEDGGIVVTGAMFNGDDYDVAFARFNVDGSLDTAFGTGPVAGTTIVDSGLFDEPAALIRQSDGKYVACGARQINELVYQGQMLAIRLYQDGSIDTGFGINGFGQVESDVLRSAGAEACVAMPDGTVVLAGFELLEPGYSVPALVRLRPDGVLDTAYWNSGVSVLDLNASASVTGIAVLSDGSLAVIGSTNSRLFAGFDSWDMYLARVDSETGLLDTDFGHQGVTVFDFGEGNTVGPSGGRALIEQLDGKLVAVGHNWLDFGLGGAARMALSRVDPRGAGHSGFVGFAGESWNVSEDAGAVSVSVRRTGGSTGAVSVDYQTAAHSATTPHDFVATSGTLTWLDGDMDPKLITVEIVEDTLVESEQRFDLVLLNSSAPLALSSVTVWVNDHDVLGLGPSSNSGGGALGIETLLLLAGAIFLNRSRRTWPRSRLFSSTAC